MSSADGKRYLNGRIMIINYNGRTGLEIHFDFGLLVGQNESNH